MATVDDAIITPALKLVLQDDASPTASEKADGLAYLNELVDELNSEKLALFQEFQEQFTLTSASSYTIGSGGAFNTTRPETLVSAFFRETNGTVDYPIVVSTTKAEWDRIAIKTLGGFPQLIWYDNAYPLGTINIWRQNAGLLFLTSMRQITEFAALSTTFAMPASYRAMLKWNLAERLFAAFSQPPREDVSRIAATTLGKVRRHNRKPTEVQNESAYLSANLGTYDIQRGW